MTFGGKFSRGVQGTQYPAAFPRQHLAPSFSGFQEIGVGESVTSGGTCSPPGRGLVGWGRNVHLQISARQYYRILLLILPRSHLKRLGLQDPALLPAHPPPEFPNYKIQLQLSLYRVFTGSR